MWAPQIPLLILITRGNDTHCQSCNEVVSTFTASSGRRREKGALAAPGWALAKETRWRDRLAGRQHMSWVVVVLGPILRGRHDWCRDLKQSNSFLIFPIIAKSPVAFDKLIHKNQWLGHGELKLRDWQGFVCCTKNSRFQCVSDEETWKNRLAQGMGAFWSFLGSRTISVVLV